MGWNAYLECSEFLLPADSIRVPWEPFGNKDSLAPTPGVLSLEIYILPASPGDWNARRTPSVLSSEKL